MNRQVSRLALWSLPCLLLACGEQQTSTIKAAWDQDNNPKLMDVSAQQNKYSANWKDLPLKAELKQRPWSDEYWPTYRGGLTYRWNDENANEKARYAYPIKAARTIKDPAVVATLSPIEKFDLFLGKPNFPYTRAERKRTQVMKTVSGQRDYEEGFEIPRWEGLCHAWAPAAMAFEEPDAVTLKNPNGLEIAFGSSDVKALLTFFLDAVESPMSPIVGLRCEEDFAQLAVRLNDNSISQEEFDRRIAANGCADTNAGTFHIVLANQIGRMNEGFVADITRDQEVWNHPVYAYETEVVSESDKPSPGAARGTVKEITVNTTMHYEVEVGAHWDAGNYEGSAFNKTYQYRLELNAKGKIIGGEWIGDERPDFLWKQETPAFTGDYKAIEKIYKASLQAKKEKQAAAPEQGL